MPAPGWPSGSSEIPSGSTTAARTYSANGISARAATCVAEHAEALVRVDPPASRRRDRRAAVEREARRRGRAGGARSRRAGPRPRRGRARPPRPRRATASAVTGFDTDASRTAPASCPRVSRRPPPRSSPRRRRTARPSRRSGAVPPRAGDTRRHVERRLITGHSPYEPRRGLLARGRRRATGSTSPAPRRSRRTARRRRTTPTSRRRCACAIIGEALDRAGSGLEHVVRTNIYVTDPAHWDEVARAHGGRVRRDAARRDLRRRAPARRRLEGRDRSRGGAPVKQVLPPSITGLEGAPAASVVDHRFGRATRTRSASRRSTCSSTRTASTSSSTSRPCSTRSRATRSPTASTRS